MPEEIIDALFDYIKTYTEGWEVYSVYMIMKNVNSIYGSKPCNAIKIRLDSKKTRDYKIEFPIIEFKECGEYSLLKPSLFKKFLSLFSSKHKKEVERWKFIDSSFRKLQNEREQEKLDKTLETIKHYKTGATHDREESN